MRVVIGYAKRDLMRVGLANDLRSSLFNFFYHEGIFLWDMVRKEF